MTSPILVAEDMERTSRHDRARSQAVLTVSAELAKRLKAPLDVVHVEDLALAPELVAFSKSYFEKLTLEGKRKLKQLGRGLAVRYRPLLLTGRAANRIVDLTAKTKKYGMVVLGSHGRTGASRLFLGSVAEEVVRNSRIPTLVLGPKAQHLTASWARSLRSPTLLLATDLGPNSRRAEEEAIALARRLGGRIVLIHCLFESLHPVLQASAQSPYAPVEIGELFTRLRMDALRMLESRERKIAALGIPCEGFMLTQNRRAGDLLAQAARKHGATLVVLGTHGRNLASSAFFGSTARKAIQTLNVPVLIVRSKR